MARITELDSDREASPGKREREEAETKATITKPPAPAEQIETQDAQTDPFVAFCIVSLVCLQLALQTQLLAPYFNTLPLTRWSRWVGVLVVVVLLSLVPTPSSLRVLLTLAATWCTISVTGGRWVGSEAGRRFGPEWGPAIASAGLAFGSLLMVARLVVASRKASVLISTVHAVALTGILWSGEILCRNLLQRVSCVPCQRLSMQPDAEVWTLCLAFLFLVFALVAYAPDVNTSKGARRTLTRLQIVWLACPTVGIAAGKMLTRPSAPFTTPAGTHILFSENSNSGRIVVGENNMGQNTYRYLRADHSLLGGQWVWKKPDGKGGNVTHFDDSIFAAFPLQEVPILAERGDKALPPRPVKGESALIIGLGVGIAATRFIERGLLVDVVEYDGVVYDAAEKYFSYGKKRPRSASIMDGAKYIRDSAFVARRNPNTPKWNYVIQDCFSAGSLPVELFTQEFWYNVQDVITDDGLVVMNFAGMVDSVASRRVFRTLLDVFPQCRAFSDVGLKPGVPGNMVFVCSRTYDPLLTFRPPTPDDIRGSYVRQDVYHQFLNREVPIDSILSDEDWDTDMILHSGAKLPYWRDAVTTWHSIDGLVSPDVWMAY